MATRVETEFQRPTKMDAIIASELSPEPTPRVLARVGAYMMMALIPVSWQERARTVEMSEARGYARRLRKFSTTDMRRRAEQVRTGGAGLAGAERRGGESVLGRVAVFAEGSVEAGVP